MDIGNQLLDFMIESVQGPCLENQILFCKNKVIDTCKDFLAKFQRKFDYNKIGFVSEEEIDQMNNVVTKSSKLLYSLIEGEVGPEILKLLYEGLDFSFILNRLKEEFITYLERINIKIEDDFDSKQLDLNDINDKLPDHFDDDLLEAFNLYLLIITLSDPLINEDSSEDIKRIFERINDRMTLKCLEFFKYHTKSIEVMFKKSIIRVYFPVHPICRLISKVTRKKFALNVNRDTQNDKIKCLMQESNSFFDEFSHLAFLKKQIINISTTKLNFIRDFSTVLAFLINFFILWAYSIGVKYSNRKFNVGYVDVTQGDIPIEQIINVLGYIQFITSTTMLLMWVIIFGPVTLKKKWNNLCFEFRNSLTDEQKLEFREKLNEDDEIDLSLKNTQDVYQILLFKGPEDLLFTKEKIIIDKNGNEIKIVYKDFGNLFTKLQYYWISIRFLFSEQTFMYMIFYICISFYGVFISEISYCLHLFDVIVKMHTEF
jgi:inositol 1,4,5-triphosphate receptor type 3